MTITREKTPFEQIRDEKFNYEIDQQLKWVSNPDQAMQWANLPTTIIKPNSVINFNQQYKSKRYNEKSKLNLVQFEKDEEQIQFSKELKEQRTKKTIENVQNWANDFLQEYEEKKGKKYNALPSKQTTEKIYRSASVFVRSVLSGFVSTRGFKQRTISFCTFTITETQKHCDDEITKTFIDFIDHLKKIKGNYIINQKGEQTKEKALIIDNYIWRSETQENGNIHFHLIADTFLNQHLLRHTWNLYIAKLGYKFGYGAANVNSLKKDKNSKKILNVEKYLCKYLTKQPLKNQYKNLKKNQLDKISDSEKYRRPVLAKSWGCSRKLLKLEYPKFYSDKAREVLTKLKSYLREVKTETIPEYIKVFAGDTRKAFRKLDYVLQRQLKDHYLLCLQYLYDEIPIDYYD